MKNTPLQNKELSQRAYAYVGSTPLILWGQKRNSRRGRFWNFVSHLFGGFWMGRNLSRNSPFIRNENGGSISHIQHPKQPSKSRVASGAEGGTRNPQGLRKIARSTMPPLPLAGQSLGSLATTSMSYTLSR